MYIDHHLSELCEKQKGFPFTKHRVHMNMFQPTVVGHLDAVVGTNDLKDCYNLKGKSQLRADQ